MAAGIAGLRTANLTGPFGGTFTDSITALAGGGQTSATALTSYFNRVSTVASLGDSVKLPPSTYTPGILGGVGCQVAVMNSGAMPMQVFGAGTDTINGVATATGVSVPPGVMATFSLGSIASGGGAGAWYAEIGNSTTLMSDFIISNVPIGSIGYSSMGTNSTDVNGRVWVTSIYIPTTKAITKIGFLQGSTATTDKMLVALYNNVGTVITTSALAGVTLSGANTFQEQTLLAAVTLTPGIYYIGVQGNGTAAGAIFTIATLTYLNCVTTVIAGTFGTVPAITVPTTFTADNGPIVYVK